MAVRTTILAPIKTPKAKNNKGMATLESLPLLVIFVILTSYTMGFFGVIHTAILHSIAARTYALETFRNRSDLTFFRHDGNEPPKQFQTKGFRLHTIVERSAGESVFPATKRDIVFGRPLPQVNHNKPNVHNEKIHDIKPRNRLGVNPVWIMVSYGICINATCGDN